MSRTRTRTYGTTGALSAVLHHPEQSGTTPWQSLEPRPLEGISYHQAPNAALRLRELMAEAHSQLLGRKD